MKDEGGSRNEQLGVFLKVIKIFNAILLFNAF